MTNQQLAALETMLVLNEGERLTRYFDTEGHPTIGVGFNLDRSGARADIEALGLDYDKARAGTQSLTQDQSRSLLRADMQSAIEGAGRIVDNFDTLSFDRQAVLVDMTFNMGEANLMGFRRMRQAVENGDWGRAADEMQDSDWFNQVGDRGPRMSEIMRTGDGSAIWGRQVSQFAPIVSPSSDSALAQGASSLSAADASLLASAEMQVRAIATEHNLPWDQGMRNTVAAVAASAKAEGLSEIGHLKVQPGGLLHFAQVDANGVLAEGLLGAREAANTSESESLQNMASRGSVREQEAAASNTYQPEMEAQARS